MNAETEQSRSESSDRAEPIISRRARDGMMAEAILKPQTGQTALAVLEGSVVIERPSVTFDGQRCVPYSARNNLLTHRVILLASGATEYGNDQDLVAAVRHFIHRYMDLEPGFEEVAAHYVLMTWLYDTFNELPYLRVRGDYGSGKSRFLLTVGSLCYKPLFASGASTVSPIFRLIDQVGGTLVVDEADFWASDERAEIVKILNNGNARGFPVLRSEVTPQKEFNPRAFDIFGPKLVATRHAFEDEALESRCLTAVLGQRQMRTDIPISLPSVFDDEARELRNQLLMYRFRRFECSSATELVAESSLAPRRAQISTPLLAVAADPEARVRLCAFLRYGDSRSHDARADVERAVLRVSKALLERSPIPLSLQKIAGEFQAICGNQYGTEVSPRWIGGVLRRLGIEPQKSNGVYVIPTIEISRLRELFARHAIGDIGDDRDVQTSVTTGA